MRFYQELRAELEEGEQFHMPAFVDSRGRIREMLAHHVFLWFYPDGTLSHAQISGTLILLNGNLSVSDEGRWTSVRVTEDELPRQVRDALKERKTHAR
jgi:hypothetical protein